ncbi:hypothetical protein QVD17_06057 [Tagetes erecta]|uniref:Uncharacterized protein n=1 Tax=Tagetes erecta TaxID=13708 RepID=A0AAD8LKZ4_TARER|nr:hypothetical protein QVD17_06057 [Tagetes erecta]
MVSTDLVQYRYVKQLQNTPSTTQLLPYSPSIYTPLRLTTYAADILTSHRASNTLTGDLFSGQIYRLNFVELLVYF